MTNLYSIIKKPLFTEKGSNLKESENKILVEVAKGANKIGGQACHRRNL